MSAEEIPGSANFAKSTDDEPFVLPDQAADLNGSPIENVYEGGVVVDGDQHYSLAKYDVVAPPADEDSTPETTDMAVLQRRIGPISIRTAVEAPEVLPEPTAGSEFEFRTVTADGTPVRSGMDNELYSSQGEVGTPVAHDRHELREVTRGMVREAATYAADRDLLASPVSIYNPEPTAEDVNPHPYIRHTNVIMTERTGFETHEAARYGSVQLHTGTGRTEDMLHVISAQQLLAPILPAASLAGPFMHGGLPDRLAKMDWNDLTETQRDHLAYVGINQTDFHGKHHSFRPVMRGVASPEPNVHDRPAPETIDEYLEFVDQRLREGSAVTADRAFGMHRDRARVVLDGSGANTIEAMNYDTFLGHDGVISEVHILQNAVIAKLEAMKRAGDDPFDFLATRFRIQAADKTDTLQQANAAYVHQTARFGNDADVYGRKPGQWVNDLMRWTELDKDPQTAEVIGKAFASNRIATEGLMRYAQEQGKDQRDFRAGEAYYATGWGSPSVAMHLERSILHRDSAFDHHEPAELTREQERRIAEDFTAFGQRD